MSPRYKPNWFLFAALLAILCFRLATVNASPPFVQVTATGSISGQVTDTVGNLLQSVRIFAYRYDEATQVWNSSGDVLSASDGSYTLTQLVPGTYRIRFLASYDSDYLSEWYLDAPDRDHATDVIVVSDQPTANIDGTLALGGQVAGTVTDEDGTALASISVVAYQYDANFDTWSWTRDTLTGADGSYLITGLEAGSYRLRFSAPDNQNYAPEWYDDAADLDDATGLSISVGQMIGNIDAALGVGGSISGTVTTEQGNPLNGMSVEAFPLYYAADLSSQIPSYSTITDAQGHYTIGGLPTGTYQVMFSYWENGTYAPEWYSDAPFRSQSQHVIVVAGESTANIDAALAIGGTINGTVTDEASNPLGDVWVDVQRYNPNTGFWESIYSVSTDNAGIYAIGGLPTGQYRIKFDPPSDSDYAAEWYDDASSYSQATDVIVTLGQTTGQIDAALAQSGNISGRVTHQADGSPLVTYAVQAHHYDADTETWEQVGEAYTEQDGTYTITNLPAGIYRVKFTRTSPYATEWYNDVLYPDQSVDVPVLAGQTTSAIDASVGEGATILGSAFDPAGVVVGGTEITAYRYDALTDTWPWIDQTHIYEFNSGYWFGGFPPGTYRFEFRPPAASGYATTWYGDAPNFETATDVIVDAEQFITHLDVTFGLTNTISGQMTLANAPLAGVTLTLSSGQSTQTNTSGNYYLTDLPAGTLTLTPTLTGYVFSPTTRTVTLPPGQNGLNFSATALVNDEGQVSGLVTDQTDLALPDIAVTAYQFQGSWQAISATVTLTDGTYALTLPVGEYRLFFADPGSDYMPQYYDNAATTALAAAVIVQTDQTTPDINAHLVEIPQPRIKVEGANISVNPATGEVTISSSQGQSETVTITRTVTCAGGADPTGVTLMVGNTSFPMTAAGSGQYVVQLTAPDDLPSGNQFDLVVSYHCQGIEQIDTVGQWRLYDPSGVITDISTGQPVSGAVVNLYRVPNAEPDQAAQSGDCRTVTTRPATSSGPFGAWSGLPPADLSSGDWANPNTESISPANNPQVTGSSGHYGWDVGEGCWFVTVRANGYEFLISPAVGVPPQVTDLDLALTPSNSTGSKESLLYLPVILRE